MVLRLALIASLLLCAFLGTVGYFYLTEFDSESQTSDAAKLLAKIEGEGEPAEDEPKRETFEGHPWPVMEGEEFPDLVFTNPEGKEVRLSQFKGKPLFVEAAAMSCGASIAFSGGESAGPYRGIPPQTGIPPIELIVRMATRGFQLDDPRIVTVQIVFFNADMQTPTPADLQEWRDHFKSARKFEPLILAAPKGLPTGATMGMIPGMMVIDRDFVVRYIDRGSSNDGEKLINLCRSLPRLADAPPDTLPEATDELVERVAKAFLADQEPKLPFEIGLPTQRSREIEFEAARKRNFHDLYRKDAPGAEAWNDDALACIDVASQRILPGITDVDDKTRAEANKRGKKAIEAGCADPILLRCYASSLEEERYDEAIEYARRALDLMNAGDYPAEAKFRVQLLLCMKLRDREKDKIPPSPELAAATGQLIPLFAKAIANPDLNPLQQEILMDRVFSEIDDKGFFERNLWQFHAAIQSEPGIEPWIVDLVSGICHNREAWRWRGGGYAHTVTEEGFDGFQRHSQAAAVCFASSWLQQPEIPIAPRNMVGVLLSGQSIANESRQFWLVQAAKARFDDLRAYRAMMWSLRPRWFGSHDAMLNFGLECLRTKRFDTDVPYIFVNALFDVASELPEEERASLFRSPEIASKLTELYTSLLAEERWNENQRRHLRTEFTIVCYLAGDMELCRKQFQLLEGKLDPDAVSRFPVKPNEVQHALGTLL